MEIALCLQSVAVVWTDKPLSQVKMSNTLINDQIYWGVGVNCASSKLLVPLTIEALEVNYIAIIRGMIL